ncbi:hypothetical protein B0T22DRAFT_219306 [Podospora appendiculata]|uniref:DUF1279 domain-containing protein n=1 Tax=Podospora appendiculata TaxID=314037 RepID=A0AAE0X5G4_9PEZI|nr:hypothetical protein B0T22DRAFT_219306 [Podospora appendiculata]
MLRATVDALLGGSVAARRVARDAAGKAARQLWTRQITTRTAPVPRNPRATMSQFLAQRFANIRPSTKAGQQLKTASFTPRRPFHSSRPRRSQQSPNPSAKADAAEPTSLSERLKKLSREYGWTAVGVYLGLSVLDFPFCFLLVRVVGTDKIAEVEEIVVRNVQKVIPERAKEFWYDYRAALKTNEREEFGNNNISEGVEMAGWGVREAEEKRKQEGASLATQLALAYAIHKSFIFVRVPLTAAILPKVVKVLRSFGWKIGKKKPTKP